MNSEIKNVLGIKQEDLAMILGVSRSQLSMYIIGKRNLPVEAKLILSKLIATFSKKSKLKISNAILLQDANNAAILMKSIRINNEYKQIVLRKKLNVLERKYTEAKKTIALIDYMEASQDDSKNDKKQLYELIKKNAEKEIQKNSITKQIPLKIEIESLKTNEIMIQKQFSKFFSDEQKL
jgi:transcriptional regulator with XRE-family HTH domain